jgi:hypothetical protein
MVGRNIKKYFEEEIESQEDPAFFQELTSVNNKITDTHKYGLLLSLFVLFICPTVLFYYIVIANARFSIILSSSHFGYYILVCIVGIVGNFLILSIYHILYLKSRAITVDISYLKTFTNISDIDDYLVSISMLLLFGWISLYVLIGIITDITINVPENVRFQFSMYISIYVIGYWIGLSLYTDPNVGENLYSSYREVTRYHDTATEAVQEGEEKLESNEYSSAVHSFENAKRALEKALDSSNHLNFENAKIENHYEKSMHKINQTATTHVSRDIKNVKSKLNIVEKSILGEEFEEANKLLNKVESILTSVKQRVDEYDIEGFDDKIDLREEKYEELTNKNNRLQTRLSLTEDVSQIRSEIDVITTLLDNYKVETAQENLEEIACNIESAKDITIRHNFDDLHDELTILEQRREEHLKKAEMLQRKQRRQQLVDEIDMLQTGFQQAEALAERRDFGDAQSTLEGLLFFISSAKDTAIQYQFNDLYEELVTLEEKRENSLKDVTERLKANPVPEIISRSPNISVEYDALIGREPIGGGGNADVTKAILPTPDGDVTLAIKEPRMSGTLHTDTVRRMLEEAETWEKLDDHDHIVGVVDYGSAPIPWIAMEYMDAGHLGERIDGVDMAQKLWTAVSITDGVYHAHRHGVAHRDLKPENILFQSVNNAWDVPKVADWGLSKHLLEHSRSRDGLTVEYAAPEQFNGSASSDNLTDIYQLGAVFYELFTGCPPFEGKMFAVMKQIETESPAPPSDIADVPDGLDEILTTALAKEKADRYDDIVYLRDALEELFDEY